MCSGSSISSFALQSALLEQPTVQSLVYNHRWQLLLNIECVLAFSLCVSPGRCFYGCCNYSLLQVFGFETLTTIGVVAEYSDSRRNTLLLDYCT